MQLEGPGTRLLTLRTQLHGIEFVLNHKGAGKDTQQTNTRLPHVGKRNRPLKINECPFSKGLFQWEDTSFNHRFLGDMLVYHLDTPVKSVQLKVYLLLAFENILGL